MSDVSLTLSFLAGVLSILSPCVLALLPAYVAYLAGVNRNRLWLHSLLFISGFFLIFLAFGASATAVGRVLAANQQVLNKVAGVVVIIFGLQIMGVLRLPTLSFIKRAPQTKYQGANSLLLGLAFGAGWSPCVGPILGSVLMLASTQTHILEGMLLLTAYSVGMAIPFILITAMYNRINFARIKSATAYLPYISGSILILLGLSLYFNVFSQLARFNFLSLY